jgi:hypothetical protein
MEIHGKNPSAGADATAFGVSERSRARSLLELLTESRADIRQGVDSSLLERERLLQQQLNAKATAQFNLMIRKHTPGQAEALAKEIDSITIEYEELRARIRARSPKYEALTVYTGAQRFDDADNLFNGLAGPDQIATVLSRALTSIR